jgi:hypothetical protein
LSQPPTTPTSGPNCRSLAIGINITHQLACESFKVAKFGSVFGRDDEAEVMAVVVAALGEGAFIPVSEVASNMRAFSPHA